QFKVSYADTLRQNGQTDRAARYYLAALMDEPQAVGALNGIGRIYLERRLFDEALTAFTRAAAADPGDYTANFFLAQTYDRLGRPAEAAPYRDRASQIVPDLIEPP
ncbi:MAG: tetratricopeptide repeat protein, partial [Chloroflexi bacterium]|nr:tetratricopeptide repeat protein [Chloroflexota bacterium]